MANLKHLEILQDAIDKDDISIWNQWREGFRDLRPDFRDADFKGVNFQQANLIQADFSGSNLSHANFSRVDLTQSQFHGANLTYARFYESNLNRASFFRANLSHADLARVTLERTFLIAANLYKVNLVGAILIETSCERANFNNARLQSTSFMDIDFSFVQNLDQVKVDGPCSIGIETLYRSQSILGEQWFQDFLRDCGVPDTMVEYASSLVVKPIDYYSCFISYSSENETFAKLLYDTLRDQNIRVWYAPEQILPGHNIKQELIRGIQHWDKVILCCSESSLTEKWWVDFERTLAETKAQDLQRKHKQSIPIIIPLDLDGYVHNGYRKHANYDPFLSSYHIADFTDWKNHDSFKREVERLIKALQTDDGRESPPASKLKPKA